MDTTEARKSISYEDANERCIEIINLDEDSTLSSNSYDSNSIMFSDSPTCQSNPSSVKTEEISSKPTLKLASDPDYETPKIKKNGFHNQPVRRRLFTQPSDESSLESCNWFFNEAEVKFQPVANEVENVDKQSGNSNSVNNSSDLVGNKIENGAEWITNIRNDQPGLAEKKKSPIKVTKIPTSEQTTEKGVSIGCNRKIAQLVVWTKNCGKLKKEDQENKKPQASEQSFRPSACEPTKDLNPEGDLFFVQYPVRPSNETSKNKVKAPKRQRKISPVVIPCNKRKKKSHKTKRSKNPSSEGSYSSGRAYRTYLHSCLEKQRQNPSCAGDIMKENGDTNLLWLLDFKVEKLFQHEEGVVVPGELPTSVESHQIQEVPSLTTGTTAVFAESGENINQPGPITEPESLGSTPPTLTVDSHFEKEKVDALNPTSISDNPHKETVSSAKEDELSPSKAIEESGTGESCEFPVFNLPDQFTVSTNAANEFDLLIQNVVHEELIDGIGEEDLSYESFRKKMKITCASNNSSKGSSQEGSNMDEAGKPRCTYTELIEKALTETGGLTVSEIYTWISDRYPFYKPDDDRWKNSVRHNLSINPYFKKGEKARSGAGHLWTISEESKGLRPSMVSWDEVSFDNDRRKCPYDPSEFIMPMENETDRAVANILGRYVSECRANQEASKDGKSEKKTKKNEHEEPMEAGVGEGNNCSAAAITELQVGNNVGVEQQPANQQQPQEQQQTAYDAIGATCETESGPPSFNINELSSGQFTVDLSGITIPEGGSINFEDLVNNGRLIYIQTDPEAEANKENESTQAVILNEALFPELSGTTNTSIAPQNNEDGYHSFYSESIGLDLGFGKGDSMSNISFAHDDILAAACAQLISDDSQQQQHNQDLTTLDQVIPMSSYEMTVSSTNGSGEGLSVNAAALYESKELGISYTYQAETNEHDLLH